jgi:two-component system, sensor histidine kinase YesM
MEDNMLKFLRKQSIRNQLVIIAIIIIAIDGILFVFINRAISSIIQNNIETYIDQITSQTAHNIDLGIEDINKIVTSISYSATIQKYLTLTNDADKVAMLPDVNKYITNMNSLKNGFRSIAVLGYNGNLYGYLDSLGFDNQLIKNLEDKKSPYCSGAYYDGQNTLIVIGSAVYNLNNMGTNSEKIGVVFLLVEPEKIGADINTSLQSDVTKFYLFDRNNRVFENNSAAANDESSIIAQKYVKCVAGEYNITWQKHDYIVKVSKIDSLGGKMVSVINKNKLFSGIWKVSGFILGIFIVSILLLFFLLVVIVNNIVNPLNKLNRFLGEIKSGNLKQLKKRISLEGYAEISNLAFSFNNMLDEIDGLTHRLVSTNTRLYEMELLKKKSEFEFLKSQINPHFLYNTLESIKCISNIRGVYEVRDMSMALAQVFRYSVKGNDIVKLSDELEVAKAYLKIQTIRFKNKFDVEYSIPEEAMDTAIPKMIIQPIVENAIYHGLELKCGTGVLKISCRIEAETSLFIKVSDDGVGINKETLSRIQSELEKINEDNTYDQNGGNDSGIGITNVAKRISMYYGGDCGTFIESTENIGTAVTIKIPYRRYICG